MNWEEWRDGSTIGVFVVGTLLSLVHACQMQDVKDKANEARKDSSPLIETCVQHPSARRVVVQ